MKNHILKLYKWLAIVDEPKKSDLIFLFGGDAKEIAHKGLELYKQNYAPLILVTGNTGTFGPHWKEPCADVFAKYLVENGIPKDKILIQNTSTNTPEDILNSLPILKKHNLDLKQIIIVSRPVHQRRAKATFEAQYPDIVELINQPCEEKDPQNMTEGELKTVGIRCLQEYERLIKYADKGDITKQNIPKEIKETVNYLAKKLTEDK